MKSPLAGYIFSLFVYCGSVLATAGFAANVSAVERPNVIFLFADDLGYGDINCHRRDDYRAAAVQPNGATGRTDEWRGKVFTPHLDRLAAEGTDFHQFMVCSPVCSPSRVATMTGHFPSRHGVHQHFASHRENVARGMPDWLSIDAPFLPRELKKAGYATGHFGKWHLGRGNGAPHPLDYGFHAFASYGAEKPHVFDNTSYANLQRPDEIGSHLSIASTDHAIRFINENASGPFYVNLWLHETHHVVSARPEDRVGYEDVPEPHQTYYAAVTRLDAQVGRVLALLDELKLADNTLVIFSSDNGPENWTPRLKFSVGSPAGMRGRKRSLMMGGVNVPFLCRWPGVVPAGRVDSSTALAGVDIMPTVLDATGVPSPVGYQPDGESILPALKGEPFQRRKPIFWYWQGHHALDNWPVFAMRDNDYGLVVDPAASRRELYHLVNDRLQKSDLTEAMPEKVEQMDAAIEAWVKTLPPLPVLDASDRSSKRQGEPDSKLKSKSIDRAAVFVRKDKNADGVLDFSEYSVGIKADPPPEERFARFDKNSDGKLTKAEFVGKQ